MSTHLTHMLHTHTHAWACQTRTLGYQYRPAQLVDRELYNGPEALKRLKFSRVGIPRNSTFPTSPGPNCPGFFRVIPINVGHVEGNHSFLRYFEFRGLLDPPPAKKPRPILPGNKSQTKSQTPVSKSKVGLAKTLPCPSQHHNSLRLSGGV